MQNFLDIDQVDPRNLRGILDEAARIKTARAGLSKGMLDAERPLEGKMVALIFEKPSTRTRVSFDLGVRQMGGQTMVLSGSEMQLGHGETIADTARVLSRYVDMIMIRTFEEATLLEMAEFMPQDLNQFSEINGVGETKLEKYGEEFLAVVKEH